MLIGEYDADIQTQRREISEKTRLEIAQRMLDSNLNTLEKISFRTKVFLNKE